MLVLRLDLVENMLILCIMELEMFEKLNITEVVGAGVQAWAQYNLEQIKMMVLHATKVHPMLISPPLLQLLREVVMGQIVK